MTDLSGTFRRGASLSAFSGWRFPACGQRDLPQPRITFECRDRKGQMGNQAEGPRLAASSPPRQGKATQPGPGPQALASLPEKVLLPPIKRSQGFKKNSGLKKKKKKPQLLIHPTNTN